MVNRKSTQGNHHILPGGCSDEPAHAVANYKQALAALQHLPENPDTMQQAIDTHLTVRVALHLLGAFTQILPHLHAAQRLDEALGDPQRLAIFPLAFQTRWSRDLHARAPLRRSPSPPHPARPV